MAEASTFTLEDKLQAERALRKAGHTMLDCPISGTGSQAKVKDIVVYASGDAARSAGSSRCSRDFHAACMTSAPSATASRMKYVANLLVAIHNVATAEAMVLGMKAGLDPKAIFETIKTGAGNSRVFELRGPMMAAEQYDDATMKVKVWQKDMAVIGDFAKSLGCPTPLFTATAADLRRRDEYRPRHAGHRRGLRGDGEHGGREAAQWQTKRDSSTTASSPV